MIIATFLLVAFFALAMLFFTANTLFSMRMAGAYPFVMIVLGLLFLYLFVASAQHYLKLINGILFLLCGFACMHDIEKLRRNKKS